LHRTRAGIQEEVSSWREMAFDAHVAAVNVLGRNRAQILIAGVLVDTVAFQLPADLVVELTDFFFDGILTHWRVSSCFESAGSLASPRAAQSSGSPSK